MSSCQTNRPRVGEADIVVSLRRIERETGGSKVQVPDASCNALCRTVSFGPSTNSRGSHRGDADRDAAVDVREEANQLLEREALELSAQDVRHARLVDAEDHRGNELVVTGEQRANL